MKNIRIAILDDHQIVIDGLLMLLNQESEIHVIKTCTKVAELYHFLDKDQPDILLLDVQLPEESGLTVCKNINNNFPQIKVIVLTMLDQVSMFKKMSTAGAKGYLLKNISQETLVNSIKRVYDGEIIVDACFEDEKFNLQSKRKLTSRSIPHLTMREKEILELIVQENTTPEMAKALYISEGTVITHRRNIIAKLGVKNTAGVVRKALELGLV